MTQQPLYKAQAGYTPSLGMVILQRSFKIFLYFVGAFLAEFGILGTALLLPGSTRQIGYVGLISGFAALIGSLLYFFLKHFTTRGLPWLQYLWWILGATIGAIMAVVLEFALVPGLNEKTPSISSAVFTSIIFLYGAVLIMIAHLQPSLRYRVNDSIRNILKTIPGKQIIITDLVTLIQEEYKCSDIIIYKYIGGLDDIEQMTIPGISTTLCRIKGKNEENIFPQIYTIINYDLRQNMARALQFLNEENVDIGLFILSKAFEDTLKAYLIEANAKGVLFTVPENKKIEKLSLPEMISCVKNNNIIKNDAVLTLLRQGRNNRAHGTMPSSAERKLLMASVPYIAGLYIDHIKLFDDLMHSLSTI